MKLWKPIPNFLPSDGEEVWVRTWNELAPPFKATFNQSTNSFHVTTAKQHQLPDPPPPPNPPVYANATVDIVFPTYCIYKWRPINL
jgi:hypothetical protein